MFKKLQYKSKRKKIVHNQSAGIKGECVKLSCQLKIDQLGGLLAAKVFLAFVKIFTIHEPVD
jgi:hypothetical protein